ncbi:hypothetical protein [Streptacidiphilus cavernicola]|uniref:DNA-binding protein n=1 Tax=Streptacidiphilus cavernicola TaxID=3342716 RepID=A0ABV6VXU5_9ACTN
MVDLSVDLTTTYWTTAEAADAAGVDANVVRNWKYRGRLTSDRKNWRGESLFLAADVVRAEKATRQKARRVYPVAA